MIAGLPVSSIPQCKYIRHGDTCLDSFQAIGHFERTFIEAHQALKMIPKVRLCKSEIKIHSFLEEIKTSSNEVFKHFESDVAVGIRKLGILT